MRQAGQRAEHLSELAGEDQDVDDLLGQGVRANILRSAAGETGAASSRVYFVLPAIGGFSGSGLAALPGQLATVLRSPKIESKIRKLATARVKERHLLLLVRPSAFSWPVYEGLALGGPLPAEAPLLPDGLSQLWLLSGLQAGGVVRAISSRGWYRDYPADKPEGFAV